MPAAAVGTLETSPELTVGLGSGWGCASINTSSSAADFSSPANPSHIRVSVPPAAAASTRRPGGSRPAAHLHTKSLSFSQAYVSTLPSEVSHFRETHGKPPQPPRPAHSVTAAITGFPPDVVGRFKRLRDSKTKSGFQIPRQTEPLGRRFG